MQVAVRSTQQIAPMSQEAMQKVEELDMLLKQHPNQISIATDHVIHGGVYYRTLCVPAGTLLSGSLVKVNTTLVIHGDCTFYVDGEPMRFRGANIVPAFAGRKQAVYAHEDTIITMSFATDAVTVAEAEEAFTDDAYRLGSRKYPECNTYLVTGV
jgi:hypothetical protein